MGRGPVWGVELVAETINWTESMIRIIGLACCIIFSVSTCAENGAPTKVDVKELVSLPEQYKGKVVQVAGCVAIGFEWQDLFPCDAPQRANRIWLDLDSDYAGKKLKDTGTKIMPVVLIGGFGTGVRYGHENGYNFVLAVTKVVSVGPKRRMPRQVVKTEN
jgi:hypothetical protein